MRRLRTALLAFAFGGALPALALAQGAPVYQSGGMTAPHDLAKITRNGQLQDVGGLTGDSTGRGANPFAVLDSGGMGVCANTGLTTGNYRAACLGHDSTGNALLTVDSYGLSNQSMKVRINGTTYPFPGAGNGNVLGPGSTADGAVATWNAADGTLLRDSGVTMRANAVATNFGPAYQAMYLSGNITGSGVGPYAEINVFDTATNTTNGTHIQALRVDHTILAGAGEGSRMGIGGSIILNSATPGASTSGHDFYSGIFAQSYMYANDGGTGLVHKGNAYALAALSELHPGATFFGSVQGGEIDVSMRAGSSARQKAVLTLYSANSDAVKGTFYDAMLGFARDNTTLVGFNFGIEFGTYFGLWPIDTTTGTIIGTTTTSPGGQFALNGLDFTHVVFSGNAIMTPGFAVDQFGNVGAHGLGIINNLANIRFQDSSAIGIPQGAHRYIGLGTGYYEYQVNTAVALDFTTVNSSYKIGLLGDFVHIKPVYYTAQTAPGSPGAGFFVIYMNSADNKLYAKGPSGTVTALALP